MLIGVVKEVKAQENRAGLTPSGVLALTAAGAAVLVEAEAGIGSGIADAEYVAAGAEMVADATDVWSRSDLVVKVKEPLESEYVHLRPGLLLYTYLHLAPLPALTRALVEQKVTGIAYETIETPDGALPLLEPMSEIAGKMSIQVGAHFLERAQGGRGVLLGGVPGVNPADVVIVGGGIVGRSAARVALGMGAHVTILERSPRQMQAIDDLFGGRVTTIMSQPVTVDTWAQRADLLIGAVLIPGAAAPKVVSRELVSKMQDGSVIVDVAVDQGGCVETTKVTTHSEPTFVVDGVVHYGVTNMPGAVPRTSTFALTNVTLPYLLNIARRGFADACRDDPALTAGVNTYDGEVTCAPVAEAQGLEFTSLHELL